ncbi:hypothetical protein HPP92_008935 [Vanilla planifolia]|uniref:Uncharacterized protein n=1 Tax=Vanilla planifolia TaxID=51239 RepID=A0A835REX6_VANPL|nr:hypothetical protein HPP92_008935 [Vanilla planifolia]
MGRTLLSTLQTSPLPLPSPRLLHHAPRHQPRLRPLRLSQPQALEAEPPASATAFRIIIQRARPKSTHGNGGQKRDRDPRPHRSGDLGSPRPRRGGSLR